jgi:integrase/recombinase XerC
MYQRDVTAYVAFAGSFDAALQSATLEEWITALAEGRLTEKGSLSPNTINRMLSSVKTVVKAMARKELITHAAADALCAVRGVSVLAMRANLKVDARTRIEAADMRRLCDAPNVATLAGLMHRAFLLSMASSGLRISELITLKPGQIKPIGNRYMVYVTGKTDITARPALLSVEAYNAIQSWLEVRPVVSDHIFTGFGGRGSRDARTNHITPVSGWRIVKYYAEKLGLESIKPHDFRRFVGTTLATTSPRHAQKALGHKKISTTYDHYVLDELPAGLTDNMF